MLGAVTDAKDARIAMCVPLAGFLTTWSFPIYLNLIKAKELDGFKESRVGIEVVPACNLCPVTSPHPHPMHLK